VRARLSDATARLPISASADLAGVCGTAHARAALAEARAILAETEPIGDTGHRSLPDILDTMWPLGDRLTDSLADALAGLCDAPDVAAYLAEMQSR